MAVAPFIKPLAVQGGTFYSMSSATQDVGMTFNNSGTKFRFTHFALLNIPTLSRPDFLNNTVQFNTTDSVLINQDTYLSPDPNINLSQSFQNYALNFESMLMSQVAYTPELNKLGVAERVFWKWLKELGVIRYQAANNMQSTTTQATAPRFVEETQVLSGPVQYNRVVQYLGDIDIVNNVQNNTNAYTEVYINVPTGDGNTPLVLFKTVADTNYFPQMAVANTPTDFLNIDIDFGRNYFDVNPSGLIINAFYDQEVLTYNPGSMFYNPIDSLYDIPKNWYDPLFGPAAYFTDGTQTVPPTPSTSLFWTDPTTDMIQKSYTSGLGTNTVTFKRSRLDGVCIDWNMLDYKPIVDNPTITTIPEYNSTVDAQSFDFNVVLLYYDLYDPNKPTDFATNLYGVLFLNNVETVGGVDEIPPFEKFMPNPVTKLNGNAFGIKINLKFDTSIDNVGVETAVNDYNTFSMELFVGSMQILQQAADNLSTSVTETKALSDQVQALQDLVINIDQFAEIDLRLTTLEDAMTANQAMFTNSADIIGMINNTNSELKLLLAGQTSISISYNLNAIRPGAGININTSIPNQVIINNINQGFDITTTYPYTGDVTLGLTILLLPFNNYFRHSTNGLNKTASGDIYINIDDTTNKWQRGQTYRLVFNDVLDMGLHSIILATDAQNKFGNGAFGMIMGALSPNQFAAANDTPIFDLTCVDPTTLTFFIDQIR